MVTTKTEKTLLNKIRETIKTPLLKSIKGIKIAKKGVVIYKILKQQTIKTKAMLNNFATINLILKFYFDLTNFNN